MKVKLDEHQLKAVKHFEGPALVVAGPGSGKTTVIIERILYLIREHNVNPEQILAIAFTNAAINEMKTRLSRKAVLSKICTLHVFGKELITIRYKFFGFSKEPETWGAENIGEIINREKYWLKRATDTTRVVIYKMVGTKGQCYIGQTTNPDRREGEHLTYSSNRRLREAIQRGDEKYELKQIKTVDGEFADWEEKEQIRIHKNRAAVILEVVPEEIVNEYQDIGVNIFKIKSKSTVTCYFGLSTDVEQSKELHFTESPNDLFREAIENEEIDISSFEVLEEGMSWADASTRLEREVRSYKKWAVFNDEDPLHARDSTRRRIEVFCKYFNVPYDEVLEHTQKFEHEMQKFDGLIDDIEKEKRQVKNGKFQPENIVDPILRAFATKYEKRKDEANAIDLFDMLILSAYMLEKDPKLLDEYREKYRYVFVDEFQDISPADFRLIKLFPDNLFTVGDDDQAIYGFRGGNSDIMQSYRARKDVKEYKATRNYRSTATIVRHAKALIEHNSGRIGKKLHAENSASSRVEVIKTSKDTVEKALINELLPVVTVCETYFKDNTPYLRDSLLQEFTTPQQIGILARNWYEVNPIKSCLNITFIKKGFHVSWSDSDDLEKRKLIMQRGQKRIEVSTIHSAKGREWDKVLILVNTMSHSINPKPSLPDQRNNLTDERRLFYVAVTRAKHELIIFDGGNCPFVSEFQELPRSERIQRLDKVHNELQSAIGNTLNDVEEQLLKVSATLSTVFNFQREVLIESSVKAVRKQYESKLEHVRNVINETNGITKKIKAILPQRLKKSKENFLPELIPVLDQLELVIKNVTETIERNSLSNELPMFRPKIHTAREHILDLFKNHGLKRIETQGRSFTPSLHEEIQSRVFTNEVPKDEIVRELQKGYILNDSIIRKAQVVVSKGEQQSDWFLNFDLTQSICFVTDHDIYFLRDISVDSEVIRGFDFQGLAVQIPKRDVLFTFAERNWNVVEPEQENVKPILQRVSISDEYLRSILANKETPALRFVIKTGYVLCGNLHSFDKEVLNILINKKIVVLFRHGLLEILEDSDIEPILEVKPTQEEIPIPSVNDPKTHDWGQIMKAYANGTPVNGKIIKYVKGGLRVRIGSLQGFLPTSQVGMGPTPELATFFGKILEMKITEFNQQQEKLVLSHRAWLEEKRRNEFLETVEIGQIVNGNVKKITSFGAFVDLGYIDGLIHKSELAWKRISHPSDVISIGDEVEVKVIDFNREQNKISLSLKKTITNPWNDIESKYPIGSTVNGFVVNIVDYGAFIQLEEGVVGLLHVSEMLHIDDGIPLTNLLNVGGEVEIVVLEISKDSNRISLSMNKPKKIY